MIDVSTLEARRHDAPPGWSRETFDAVTDAIAQALVSAIRREREAQAEERGA